MLDQHSLHVVELRGDELPLLLVLLVLLLLLQLLDESLVGGLPLLDRLSVDPALVEMFSIARLDQPFPKVELELGDRIFDLLRDAVYPLDVPFEEADVGHGVVNPLEGVKKQLHAPEGADHIHSLEVLLNRERGGKQKLRQFLPRRRWYGNVSR